MGPDGLFGGREHLFRTPSGVYLKTREPGNCRASVIVAFAADDVEIVVWLPRQCSFGSNFELDDEIGSESGGFGEQSSFALGGPSKTAAVLQSWAVANGLELALWVAIKQNDASAISEPPSEPQEPQFSAQQKQIEKAIRFFGKGNGMCRACFLLRPARFLSFQQASRAAVAPHLSSPPDHRPNPYTSGAHRVYGAATALVTG